MLLGFGFFLAFFIFKFGRQSSLGPGNPAKKSTQKVKTSYSIMMSAPDAAAASSSIRVGTGRSAILLARLKALRDKQQLKKEQEQEQQDQDQDSPERQRQLDQIVRQLEYYFGDYNLPKDRFMQDTMDDHDGWIPLKVLMTFPRLRNLSDGDHTLVLKAASKSQSGVIDLDADWPGMTPSGRMRRDPNNPAPRLTDDRRMELQERTLFVVGFDREKTKLDDLISYFEEGPVKGVCNVRMRTKRPFEDGNNNKKRDENQNEEEEEVKLYNAVFFSFLVHK